MSEEHTGSSVDIKGVTGPVAAAGRDLTGHVEQQMAVAQVSEVQNLLAELRQEIDAHAGELSDPDELRDVTDSLESEMHSPEPKAGTIRTLLRGLTDGAGQVASLVDVIARLEGAVRTVL